MSSTYLPNCSENWSKNSSDFTLTMFLPGNHPCFFQLLLLFICVPLIAGAQINGSNMVHAVTAEQGLSHSVNDFLYKDRMGFLWISSIDGLNRFDGRKVCVYKPLNGDKGKIYGTNILGNFWEDKNNDLWFATDLAINCYRRKTGVFDHFFVQSDGIQIKDVPYHLIYLESSRYLWVTVDSLLFKFDTYAPERPDASKKLHSLIAARYAVWPAEGPVKKLYAAYWTYGNGLEAISYDQYQNIIERKICLSGNTSDLTFNISQIYAESETLLWLACGAGLAALNPSKPNEVKIFSKKGKPTGVARLSPWDKNRLAVAMNDGPLDCFDKITHSFCADNEMETSSLNPEKNQVNSIFVDNTGTLWYSISKKGVHFTQTRRQNFIAPFSGVKALKPDIKQLIEREQGKVCGISENGLVFSFDNHKQPTQSHRLAPYSVFVKAPLNRQIWNVSDYALTPCNSQLKPSIPAIDLPGNPLYSVCMSGSTFYLGTLDGVFEKRTEKGEFSKLSTTSGIILSLLADREDRLWVGSNFDLKVLNRGISTAPLIIADFPNTAAVHHLLEDTLRHCIWAATSKGLLKLTNGETPRVDTLIAEANGLPNQYLYALVIDRKGRLWMSSNKGIIRYHPEAQAGQQFKHYTTRNGLSSNEYNRGAALLSSSGEVWFGSPQGVDVFHPDSVHDIGQAPQLAIVGLQIHDKPWQSDTVSIEMARRLDLQYNQNTLRFDLAAMEYTDPEMNRFKAVLQPLSNRWEQWLQRLGFRAGPDSARWDELGTQNFITYANLRPGDYLFQFTACNSEGIWQQNPRRLWIHIQPPYWQTWWFRLLLATLALALVGIGTAVYYRYQLRVQQLESARRERALEHERYTLELKNMEAEKELALRRQRDSISGDMHDELGGGLVSIGAQSKRARKMEASPEIKQILARIGDIAYTLNRNMRNLSWATDPEMDNLGSLLSRLRKEARDFFDDHALEARIEIPVEAPNMALSGAFRLHILRAVLEALNNIAKHAQATEAALKVTTDDRLHIYLRDNGVGFNPEEKAGSSKGLRSMSKRMETLGGNIEWQRNTDGPGMTVYMSVPMPLETQK